MIDDTIDSMNGGTNSRKTRGSISKYRSTTHYILSSLIPYTEANLKLAFKPTQFFNDLEKIGAYKAKQSTLATGYYKAVKDGLIRVDNTGTPVLTEAGHKELQRYEPKILSGSSSILVIFDIPEKDRHLRQRLRTLLRELHFKPVQQSVWQSEYDVLASLTPELKHLGLHEYVQVYESARII